jgi:K+-transporting ATPase KdpC subunit
MVRPLIVVFVALALLTGLAYPLSVTAVGQTFFPNQSNGSFLEEGDQTVGSRLIGQPFTSDKYFWGRPSATAGVPYEAGASSGSNMGVTHPDLVRLVEERVAMYHAAEKRHGIADERPVPVDLVTASGSGLDPEISVGGAEYQVERVAAARGIDRYRLKLLVAQNTRRRGFDILGEATVNVLQLNLALDKLGAAGK